MGSASPVMPSGEPCWDAALENDTSTKAASWATVGPVCSALLCMESALGGIKEMSNVLNNKLPGCWDPRQEARCGHPSKNPRAQHWKLADSAAHAHPLCHPPRSVLCLGWAWPGLLFCPLLCSGGSDSCYRGRLFTQRISSYTHNDPIAPACLANQLLRSAINRQGGENELTVSLVRHLHFTLHMRPETALFRPQITELTEIQWHRLCFFLSFTHRRQDGRKIGQTPRRCGSTENGCCGGRVHQNGGLQRRWAEKGGALTVLTIQPVITW